MKPATGAMPLPTRPAFRLRLALAAAWLAIVFAACGGGGGGGGGAANQAPTAAFAATPTSGNAPLAVAFNASAASDADGTITGYAWRFGDGATGSGVTASHTYTAGGTFTATLTVTDNSGATSTASKTITVTNTVSGTVSTANTMAFDSDTNDPGAPYVQNDDFDNAQALTSPATVGGYVNIVGSGNSGRSFNVGDPSDFFKVTLDKDQTVSLHIPDAQAADLNLFVYDNGRVLHNSSVGTGPTETVTVGLLGENIYYVEVRAEPLGTVGAVDASSYTLFIGQSVSSAGIEELHLKDDFVPGEVVVRFREGGLGAASMKNPDIRAENVGLQSFGGGAGRAMLMGFRESTEKQKAFDRLGINPSDSGAFVATGSDDKIQEKQDTLQIIRALRKRSDVISADPNYIVHSALVPNDIDYNKQQWHYGLINLPAAWDKTTGNDSVIVAVVDTGVLLTHPDLNGRLVPGYDFVSSTFRSRDGDGIDSDPTDPGDDPDPGESVFHGTHVAGTIAAATNNAAGVAGVTWAGKVMPVRVLGRGGGTSYDVLQGIRYAAGLSNDSGTVPAQPAQIINLSLGGGSYSSSDQSLYTQIRNAGILVVAAAGNNNSSAKSYPAAYDGVVSVSAVDRNKAKAPYSNYGSTIDVAAPGGDTTGAAANGIYSTVGDDSSGSIVMTYKFYQGTSMAAPHVAGVASLMKAVYPAMTPDEFDGLLQGEVITEDLGAAGRDNSFGYGLIDADKAVTQAAALAAGGALPASLVVGPSALNYGTALTSLTLEAGNSGAGALTIADVTADVAWISAITPPAGGGFPLGTYTVQVNRAILTVGTHTGTITFDSDVNDVEIPVTVQVSSAAAGSNDGYHYVLLLDPGTLDPKYQTAGSAAGGELDYTLTGVAPGSYRLFTGTDADNNGTIGDAGEAIGAYISLDNPVNVPVNANQSGLDFDTEFNLVSQPTASGTAMAPESIRRLVPMKSVN